MALMYLSVHQCAHQQNFFSKTFFCTLQAHQCTMYTRVHNILYDEHFLLCAILDVYSNSLGLPVCTQNTICSGVQYTSLRVKIVRRNDAGFRVHGSFQGGQWYEFAHSIAQTLGTGDWQPQYLRQWTRMHHRLLLDTLTTMVSQADPNLKFAGVLINKKLRCAQKHYDYIHIPLKCALECTTTTQSVHKSAHTTTIDNRCAHLMCF